MALPDLLTGMHDLVMSLELPPHASAPVHSQMALIVYRRSRTASERIQLSALLASVKTTVDMATAS